MKSEYAKIDDFNKSIFLELKTRLPNYILARADRNSMAHSVELRVPFLANRMIDFAMTVPPLLKMLGLKEKYIVRSAFKGKVPPHVLARMKFGYVAPAGSLWSGDDELREEVLSASALTKTALFSPAAVGALRAEYGSTNSVRRRRQVETLLTGVLAVQLLHQRFVEQT